MTCVAIARGKSNGPFPPQIPGRMPRIFRLSDKSGSGLNLSSASTAGREARPRVPGCQTINLVLAPLQYSACLSALWASSGAGAGGDALEPPALHRGGNAQCLAIFRDRAARDVDAVALEPLNDLVVRQHIASGLGIDHLADAVAHRFRRMRVACVGCGDRRREEIF